MRYLLFSLFIVFYFTSVSTASYMVERHIFTPEPEVEETNDSKDEGNIEPQEIKKIKNELMFTGVIILPDVKKVLIREKGKNRIADGVSVMKEGDTINDMTIKKISGNYIVLTNPKGDDIRFNLYNDSKLRPNAPPAPKVDSHEAKQAQTPNQASASNKSNNQNNTGSATTLKPLRPQKSLKRRTAGNSNDNQSPSVPASSFSQAINRALQGRSSTGGSTTKTSSTSNPFLEAIKRAQNRSSK